MFKRLISLALAAVLMLTLVSVKAVSAATNYADAELARAVELRFGEYRTSNPTVTYAQFFKMLDRVTELHDASKLAQWKAMLPEARASQREMTRYEAMMAVIKLVKVLGGDFLQFNNYIPLNQFRDEITEERISEEIVSMADLCDLIPAEPEYKWDIGWVDPWMAFHYAYGRMSLVNNKTLLDYDVQNKSMHYNNKLTHTAAILVALRLYDSYDRSPYMNKSDIAKQEPRYVSIEEVGTYNKRIISDVLLNKPSSLPEASNRNVPYWTGITLEGKFVKSSWLSPDGKAWADSTWQNTAGPAYYYENQVQFLAENGFNALRIVYGLSYLSNPDDPRSINVSELEQLDELISWCMKYDVHLMIMNFGLPGTYADKMEEMMAFNYAAFTDPDMTKLYTDYMVMLARRYKDIPNRNLSFQIGFEMGAPNPEIFYDVISEVIKKMWVESPGQLIFTAGYGLSEKFAELGCALTLTDGHIYMVSDGTLGSHGIYDLDYRCQWPMEFLPSWLRPEERGHKPLTLKSEKGFKAGKIDVYYMMGGVLIKADGKTIAVSKNNPNDKAVLVSANIPEGTKEITVSGPIIEGVWYGSQLIAVRITEGGKELVTLTSHTAHMAPVETDIMPTILVHPDGSTENIDNPKQVLDETYIYERFIKKWVDIAKEYNVGLMMSEVGTDTMHLTMDEYLKYHSVWLRLWENAGIAWFYNCMENIYAPRNRLWPPSLTCNAQRDGNTPFFILPEITNLLSEYANETSKARAATMPPLPRLNQKGGAAGNVLNTDIKVYINDVQIMGYNINNGIYIVAEDLRPYGFNVARDGFSRILSITKGTPRGEVKTIPVNTQRPGSIAFPYINTDNITFVEGKIVQSYNIQGQTVIRIADIAAAYGKYAWDGSARTVKVTIP